MHRKGLGGMDTIDNGRIGAKSERTHPLGINTIKGCALRERERAFEQTQTIQHTTVVHG